jgi:hypothetical protein
VLQSEDPEKGEEVTKLKIEIKILARDVEKLLDGQKEKEGRQN